MEEITRTLIEGQAGVGGKKAWKGLSVVIAYAP